MNKEKVENKSQREYTRTLMKRPFWMYLFMGRGSYLAGLAGILLFIWAFAMSAEGGTDKFQQYFTIFTILAFCLGLYLPKAAAVTFPKLNETKLGRIIFRGMIILAIIFAGWAYLQQKQSREAMHEKVREINARHEAVEGSDNLDEPATRPPVSEEISAVADVEPKRQPLELRCGMIGWPDAPVAQCKYDDGNGEVTLSKPCEPRGNNWHCTYPSPSAD